MTEASDESPANTRAYKVLAEYFVRIDRGERIDREDFIQQFPDCAAELRAYFADSEAMDHSLHLFSSETKANSSSPSVVESRDMGKYTLLDEIGHGGMGRVYKACHQRMKRIVALKVLPKDVAGSPETVRRFQKEVEAVARLSHPNIVTAHDADEADGVHFLVMEYVEGCDLARLVRERGPLPVAKALDYTIQAARGLEYAHARGVIHRDIKPSNLLVDLDDRVKVLDMGLARLNHPAESQGSAATLTETGAFLGTIDYMAPEQAEDTHQADERSDIYSLGCTLFYLLLGRAVYGDEKAVRKILAHRESEIPSLPALRQDIPEELGTVFQRMIAKAPEDRFASMSEVIAQLERCQLSPAAPVRSADARPPASPPIEQGESFPHIRRARTKSARRPVPAAGGRRTRSRLAVVALGCGGILVAAAVLILLRMQDGTLVVEVFEPDVTVQVLDEKQTVIVERKATHETIEIPIPPGVRVVRAVRDGQELFTQQVVVRAGERMVIDSSERPPIVAPPPPSELPSVPDRPDEPTTADGQWSLPPEAPPPAVAPFDGKQARAHQEAWARYLGVPVEMTNSIGMKFVLIPPGEFQMGATQTEMDWAAADAGGAADYAARETPQHTVLISRPFYLATCEVTQANYAQVMGMNPSSCGRAEELPDTDNGIYPVETVSWNDVTLFCQRLSQLQAETDAGRTYHLPTEAQWEYACRAGSTARWSVTDEPTALEDHAWHGDNAHGHTWPVARKTANAWGLHDMLGNVFEWCQDWDRPDFYKDSPRVDPTGPPVGSSFIIRGGGWPAPPRDCRSAFRGWAGSPGPSVGFRVAVAADKSEADAPFLTDRWYNLLPLCDPQSDALLGDWRFEGEDLATGDNGDLPARIMLPVDPQAGYDLRMRFTPLEITDRAGGLALILPVGAATTEMCVDIGEGRRAGLGLAGAAWWENETTTTVELQRGATHTLLATVHVASDEAQINVELNNRRVISWHGPVTGLAASWDWPVLYRSIGLGANQGIRFHAVDFRALGSTASRPVKDSWSDPLATLRRREFEVETDQEGQVIGLAANRHAAISDVELSHLSEFPRLARVQLGSNSAISDRGAAVLANLSQLKDLSLEGTSVTDEGIRQLESLAGLERLNVYRTRLSDEGMEAIAKHKGLVYLNIGWTSVSDSGLGHVAKLPHLKTLDMTFSQVGDAGIRGLQGLPLEELCLVGDQGVTDAALATLATLSELRLLNLTGTSVTDAGLDHLAGVPHLAKLYLVGTKVGDKGVASLTNHADLIELDLRGSEVTDAGLVHLAEMKSLRHLDLFDTRVSAAGIAKLRESLPLCTIASQYP